MTIVFVVTVSAVCCDTFVDLLLLIYLWTTYLPVCHVIGPSSAGCVHFTSRVCRFDIFLDDRDDHLTLLVGMG